MTDNWEWLIAGAVNLVTVAGTWAVAMHRLKRLELEVAALTKALKGEGESTGLAGRMQSVEQKQKEHSRQLSKVWERVDGRNSGIGSHKPPSDSGDCR